jgi:SAM-dependent methyltransferase
MANKLIPGDLRGGRVLDVGCGSYPTFLTRTRFAERHGVDRLLSSATIEALRKVSVQLQAYDADRDDRLPFAEDFFAVVTMLAVYEHLAEDRLKLLLTEIRRVLRPRGLFVMTTPAHWTDPVLSLMSSVGLVSSEELDEHKRSHRHDEIRPLLEEAGFPRFGLRMGYFEARMNIWVAAEK